MGDTPRKSYKDIMSASATDELSGGSLAVAKDGAGKEGGGPENGTTAATPEEILSRAPPRAHFYYSLANTGESDKPMTGDERCKGFEQFQSMLQPGIFGEKVGPVENAEIGDQLRDWEAQVPRPFGGRSGRVHLQRRQCHLGCGRWRLHRRWSWSLS